MKKNEKLSFGIVLVTAAVVISACAGKVSEAPKEESKAEFEIESEMETGSSAVAEDSSVFGNFQTTDLEGNAMTPEIFADYDLTMVNLWGTFCGPCIKEMPELGAINAEYKEKGLQVVGIVIDVADREGNLYEDGVMTAKEIVDKTGAEYTHLLPSKDLINAKLNEVTAVPETIFVDKEGNQIGESYLGARSGDEWKAIIEELLPTVKE